MKTKKLKTIFSFICIATLFLFVTLGFPFISAFSQETEEAASENTEIIPELPDTAPEESSPAEAAQPKFLPPINPRYLPGEEALHIGSSQKVAENKTVQEMVTIFGSSEMAGVTNRDMVTVFGNSDMTGQVYGDMVTVFGNAEVDGIVGHDLVVVFGSLKLGPHAAVYGECFSVFGKIDQHPDASLARGAVTVMPQLSGLKDYLVSGPLLGRLLPPDSLFAWIVVGLHFLLYFLVAVLLPKPTASVVRQLDDNPFLSFGIGLLAMILLVPLIIILAATGIGVLLLPLIGAAEIAFGILGKTAFLEFFGLQIFRRFGPSADSRPVLAFLLGFILVTLLYMVPILGLLIWLVLRPLSIGAALLAVFRNLRKNGNGNSAPGIPIKQDPPHERNTDGTFVPPVAPPAQQNADMELPDTQASYSEEQETTIPHADNSQTHILQRAGFWIRLAATALDGILLGWIFAFTGTIFGLFWLAYHIAMWTWKGTTIGGIICRLKVVRLDGSPLDFGASFVRSLAAFFSAAALGLGFFWVGWTRERQSWHDMITGTVIVRVPQSIPII